MKLEIEINVKPFDVPETVRLDENHFAFPNTIFDMMFETNGERNVTVPIAMLSVKDLHKLCDDFRDSVFENAGKEQHETVYMGEKRSGHSGD